MTHSTIGLLVLIAALYFIAPTVRRFVPGLLLFVGLFFYFNEKLPWSHKQEKKAWNAVCTQVSTLFKPER